MNRARPLLTTTLAVLAIFSASAAIMRLLHITQALSEWQRHFADSGKSNVFVYALVFALCNVLVLPGGILNMGSRRDLRDGGALLV